MEKTNGLDPAFSSSLTFDKDGDSYGGERGLTKREYFAGLAMQGILAGADINNDNGIHVNGGFIHPSTIAKEAVEIADALIEALNIATIHDTPHQ